jgi:hypothetical protein
VQPVTELEQQALRQLGIDRSELGKGAMALLRLQQAKVGDGQLEAAAIQIPIHSGSSAPGSQRVGAPITSGRWPDQQVALPPLPRP